MKLLIYKPEDGSIVARIMCGRKQAVNYPYRREANDEEFRQPGFLKVDLNKPEGPLIVVEEPR